MSAEQLFIEVLKVVGALVLGGFGTWLYPRMKPQQEKQKDQTAADRAGWELLREQMSWARGEVKDMRGDFERLASRYDDLVQAVEEEPDGGARIKARLPRYSSPTAAQQQAAGKG